MSHRANEKFKGITGFDFGQVPDEQRERNGRHIRRFILDAYGMDTSVSVASGYGPEVRVYVIDLKRNEPTQPEPLFTGDFEPRNGSVISEKDLRAEDEARALDVEGDLQEFKANVFGAPGRDTRVNRRQYAALTGAVL